MPRWLPALVTRRPKSVLAASVLLLVVAAVLGVFSFGNLKGGGFDDPNSESTRADAALSGQFGVPETNLVVLVHADQGTVDGEAVATDARDVVESLRNEPGVEVLADYWSAQGPAREGLRSRDGTEALIVLNVAGDEDAVDARSAELGEEYTKDTGTAGFRTGGFGQISSDVNQQITADLARAESIAIPLTVLLLVIAFGALAAAVLPLIVAVFSIFGTFAVLFLLTLVTDVSIFSLNLTTALAIGLGVDYSLLIVSRFREELARRGETPDRAAVAEAVTRTMNTAGRTVLFSALVVAVALSALVIFPMYFLRSFAFAGVAVVLVAALTSLLTIPAVLTLLGAKVNWGRIGRRRAPSLDGSRFWRRVGSFVMRRPVLTGLPVVALLIALGAPFLQASFGLPDDRVLPDSAQGRQVAEAIRNDFASQDANAVPVVMPVGTGSDDALTSYALNLSDLPNVARVDTAVGSYAAGDTVGPPTPGLGDSQTGTWLRVVPSVSAISDEAQTLVGDIRAVEAPGDVLVGGIAAQTLDTRDAIFGLLPYGAALIAITSFVLLFLFTGSVVLPLKALAINVVSIVGVIGALTWVFQEGHGQDLLGFTPMPLSLAMVILMFCVSFGLSMDYEVFLLGRIKERHDLGEDTTTAVVEGLARTGRIVSTAAALLAITFFAFLVSEVSFLQMFGLGAGLAIVLDATLVRGVLVPALMRLMGDVNWWAPGPLRRFHDRFGLREEISEPEKVATSV